MLSEDVLDNFIYYMIDIDGDQEHKDKVIFLAEQVFKYTDSEDKIFLELRSIYNKLVE